MLLLPKTMAYNMCPRSHALGISNVLDHIRLTAAEETVFGPKEMPPTLSHQKNECQQHVSCPKIEQRLHVPGHTCHQVSHDPQALCWSVAAIVECDGKLQKARDKKHAFSAKMIWDIHA